LPRSNVCSTRDLENPSASVHRKRFSTRSLTLKFLCAGKLNPRIEIIIVAFIYPKFMIDGKRGHDRNIPVWVIGTVYAIAIARAALVKLGWLVTLPDQNVMTPINVISFLMSMLLGIAGLALLVELGFRKGRAGPNQYGPDPLANT